MIGWMIILIIGIPVLLVLWGMALYEACQNGIEGQVLFWIVTLLFIGGILAACRI
jgi:MFS-type transporter involved in bile tolerance (Atg22 family)